MFSTVSPLVRAILSSGVVVWVVVEARQGLQRRPEARSADRGSLVAVRLSTLIAVGGAFLVRRWLPSASIGTDVLAAWIGLIVVWCGIGLRLWSFHALGSYFTVTVQTSQDQPVISSGPYRLIRHPGYAGFLVVVIGMGFAMDNWASVVVLAGVTASGIVYRIAVEEGALSRDLGGRYQHYAEGRKRLIPFIW